MYTQLYMDIPIAFFVCVVFYACVLNQLSMFYGFLSPPVIAYLVYYASAPWSAYNYSSLNSSYFSLLYIRA